MCGRFVITTPPEALRQLFGYAEQPNFPPRFNVAPTQPVPVIIIENGVRHFRLMRWGLLPAWVKDPRQFSLVINARSETLLEKPAFKNAIKRRRCLIPADGYYEWHGFENRKRPYFIHRRDGQPFGFAALSETWMGPNGEEMDTVAIVTAAASPDLAVLHHRVPVTIRPVDFDRWLDGRAYDVETAMALLIAPREGEFAWHEISTRVNRVANDDAQLLLPITDEQRAAEKPVVAKRAMPRKPAPLTGNEGQGSLF
ncbi:MAG: SOS response-associated peptidase [Bradyrhizobium sp.]|uniref:SOS response-associated peptidase n=1 Tax=Bradyrhizobium sp. TaxID=376 RepID=UPI001EB8F133|nr:SOS response-associated peptidase [Bradyrhizobium sp.]MBU6458377.1 SOS response-associated peptidase [Bradyrhizobium sp.]MDE2329762.1 SOS response-associated peptidase [Bradyrhizobium sp.]MDE2602259.1 SOS response-associated peptidase [Bradyrhizobium sp.]